MNLVISLIFGAICGWLASMILKGRSSGLVMNIILGLIGGAIGHFVVHFLGIHFSHYLIRDIVSGTLGAIILMQISKFAR